MEIDDSNVDIEIKFSKDRRMAIIRIKAEQAMNSLDIAWALEWYIGKLMKIDAAEREKPKRLI